MPFRKRRADGTYRPYYYVRRRLPGFGDTGTLSTKTKRIERAREMEQLLVYLADEGYDDLLEALRPEGPGKSGRFDLATLLRAKKRSALRELRDGLTDPALRAAIKAFAELGGLTDENRRGLRHLVRILEAVAPADARLSWLTNPKHINTVTGFMLAEGYAVRYVAHSVWTSISKLLQHELGQARARLILAEAQRPHEDDARDVWLTPAEVHALISACAWEMRMFVLLACTLGVDLSPILRIRARDVDWSTWRLLVRDTKEKARERRIELPPVAALVLSSMNAGHAASEKLFTLTRGQVAYRWRKAREATGMTRAQGYSDDVRVKDLRHTFAVHYLSAGGNLAGLMHRMGHTRGEQSMAYAKHEARGLSDMEAAAEALGLSLPAHLAAQLSPPEEAEDQEAIEIPAWWFDRHAGPQGPKRYSARGTAGSDTPAYRQAYNERRRAEHPARTEAR